MHKPEFKAKVALTAIQGEMTMAEMVKKFEVQATQITAWKKQLLDNAPDAFGRSVKVVEDSEKKIQELQDAIAVHGAPEIFNTDQCSQFTSEAFTDVLKAHDVRICELAWTARGDGSTTSWSSACGAASNTRRPI